MIKHIIDNKKRVIIVAVVLFLAALIRLYNFENRIVFGPEQAMSLIVSGNNIINKPSLLGQELFRVTSEGHILYSSALFSYSLVPLQILFNFDPVPITLYFALLNIVTGLLFFVVIKQIFNFRVALLSMILFMFNYQMIRHSMFIWIENYLPILGVGLIYLLYKFIKTEKEANLKVLNYFVSKRLLLAGGVGILSGVGFGLEYAYSLAIIIILVMICWLSKNRIFDCIAFVAGCVLGTFPMFIFEIRHNFYHLVTLFKFLLEGNDVGIVYYHYLYLWPVVLLIAGLILGYVYQKKKFTFVVLFIILFGINMLPNKLSFSKAQGMSPDFTVSTWVQSAEYIARDKPENFNVAALLDFDSRANPLRYYLIFKYYQKPEVVENYKNIKNLYVVAEKNYNFDKAITWEIQEFKPFQMADQKELNNRYTLYKLRK